MLVLYGSAETLQEIKFKMGEMAVEYRPVCDLITVVCQQGRKEMFYLTTHSTHFIYSYMASDIWLRTIPIVRKEICCRH